MGLQNLIDRSLVKLIRNHADSKLLRARFRKLHRIDIGDYTIGAFDRWRIPPGTRIGRYCSIAGSARILDANHPVDALSTHPLFYLKGLGLVDEDRVRSTPTVVEDDVWLGHQCIITPEAKRVGRGAVVGAGAVVTRDVPPYAIMVGAPAKLARYRFAPEVIEAIEDTRWWELDRDALLAASRKAPGFLTGPTVENARAFLEALGRKAPERHATATPEPESAPAPLLPEAELFAILRREIPDFSAAHWDTPFAELAIDSFGLINLRLLLESAAQTQISDAVWGRLQTPRDLTSIAGRMEASPSRPDASRASVPAAPAAPAPTAAEIRGAGETRSYSLNMPQMALSGLSEPWLFKEVGDIHWGNITRGLDTSSALIADDTGARLYATFTRFRLQSEIPLTSFRENDAFSIDMSASRLGAGIFFGDARLVAPTGGLRAQVMTSFAKFGEHGANTSLLKGQPAIPEGCPIPALGEMPAFGLEYRENRARAKQDVLFETEYAIQPPHDINGVGLLYFAAYPTVTDLCANAIGGPRISTEFSTAMRDVCYFANCSPDDRIVYRATQWIEDEAGLRIEATLSRKSDDVTMAYVVTHKQRIA